MTDIENRRSAVCLGLGGRRFLPAAGIVFQCQLVWPGPAARHRRGAAEVCVKAPRAPQAWSEVSLPPAGGRRRRGVRSVCVGAPRVAVPAGGGNRCPMSGKWPWARQAPLARSAFSFPPARRAPMRISLPGGRRAAIPTSTRNQFSMSVSLPWARRAPQARSASSLPRARRAPQPRSAVSLPRAPRVAIPAGGGNCFSMFVSLPQRQSDRAPRLKRSAGLG